MNKSVAAYIHYPAGGHLKAQTQSNGWSDYRLTWERHHPMIMPWSPCTLEVVLRYSSLTPRNTDNVLDNLFRLRNARPTHPSIAMSNRDRSMLHWRGLRPTYIDHKLKIWIFGQQNDRSPGGENIQSVPKEPHNCAERNPTEWGCPNRAGKHIRTTIKASQDRLVTKEIS